MFDERRVFLVLPDGARLELPDPPAGASHVEVPGVACASCARPLRARGKGATRTSVDDRAYEADGVCVDCGALAGVIRDEVNTLFGLTEDRAMGGGVGADDYAARRNVVDCARCGMRHYGAQAIAACVACKHPMTPAATTAEGTR